MNQGTVWEGGNPQNRVPEWTAGPKYVCVGLPQSQFCALAHNESAEHSSSKMRV